MTKRKQRRTFVMVTVSMGIIFIPFISSIGGYVFGDEVKASPFLETPDGGFEDCVKDVSYMRFHHMDVLRRMRARAVRDGMRGETTLDKCRGCHPSRGGFCNRCHEAASVSLDCFGCHYYPID